MEVRIAVAVGIIDAWVPSDAAFELGYVVAIKYGIDSLLNVT